MPLRMQVVWRSIPVSGTFFHEDLVMKIFPRPHLPLLLIQVLSSCQLMAKECMLSTGKLCLVGLPRNNVVSIADSPDITLAVYGGNKAINQTNKQIKNLSLGRESQQKK